MDPTAFQALAERCAPAGADLKPLAAIVREASSFEPLALRFDGGPGGTMKLLGSSKPEAIGLASELVIAGHQVRVGLASIDTRDLERLGVSVADGFDPCANIRAAARLVAEEPGRLKGDPNGDPVRPGQARTAQTAGPERLGRHAGGPAPPPRPPRSWDVYGHGVRDAALVYRTQD